LIFCPASGLLDAVTTSQSASQDATGRLHLLYELNRRLTTASDLDELVRFATRRTRELFEADGCSILLLDAERAEFHFPVSSQSESQRASQSVLESIRFPAAQGIAGWVVANDTPALVTDVTRDSRFYPGVDTHTQMETQSVLCAPLRTASGNIGAIEIVNPAPGFLSVEHLEFLEALAGDVAVACEKARLYERLRREVIGLRQLSGFCGLAIVVLGAVAIGGLVFRHLARALPLFELAARPELWVALAAVAVGLSVIGIARGSWSRDRSLLV
jgi:GAF domain-containing protein